MNWTEPAHSRRRVDLAGKDLAGGAAAGRKDEALRIAASWRSAHAFPLNTIQNGLRRMTRSLSGEAIVSQRLKRTPSIIDKLRRFPHMKLSRMHDIGGCRAIVDSVTRVEALRAAYARSSARHHFKREYDYIAKPKGSGYRGVHLVYGYRGTGNDSYAGLLIEVQLRSKLQHAWATAVETAGAFQGQALKSSQGEEAWLRFFALVSSAFARREKRPPPPGTPSGDHLCEDIRRLAAELGAVAKLKQYRTLVDQLPVRTVPNAHYFLLERRPDLSSLYITGYGKNELERADDEYFETEAKLSGIPGADVVLVSADSVKALRRAYPNYRLDTNSFLRALRPILAG